MPHSHLTVDYRFACDLCPAVRVEAIPCGYWTPDQRIPVPQLPASWLFLGSTLVCDAHQLALVDDRGRTWAVGGALGLAEGPVLRAYAGLTNAVHDQAKADAERARQRADDLASFTIAGGTKTPR